MSEKLLDDNIEGVPKLRDNIIAFNEYFLLVVLGFLFLYMNYVNVVDSLDDGKLSGKVIGDSIGMAMCFLPPFLYFYKWRTLSIQIDNSVVKWDITWSWQDIGKYILIVESMASFVVGILFVFVKKMSLLYGDFIPYFGVATFISGGVLLYHLLLTERKRKRFLGYIEELPEEEQQLIWDKKRRIEHG